MGFAVRVREHLDVNSSLRSAAPRTGFLGLGPQLFVPFDVVTNVDGNRVYRDASKDEIDSRGWGQRPAESVGAGQGMYGTMPSATAEAKSWIHR